MLLNIQKHLLNCHCWWCPALYRVLRTTCLHIQNWSWTHNIGFHSECTYSICAQKHWTKCPKVPGLYQQVYQQAAGLCGSPRLLSTKKKAEDIVPSRVAIPKYLTNRKWTRKVVKKLQEVSELTGPDTLVYDCTPGEGLLSRELLKAGVESITCWVLKAPRGRAATMTTALSKLEKESKGRVSIKRKPYYINILTAFENFPFQGNASTDGAKKVIAIACLRTSDLTIFFSQLAVLLSLRPELASDTSGNLEHYLFVNSYELRCMQGTISNRTFHLGFAWLSIFHLFFNIDCLLEVPETAFEPVSPSSKEDEQLHLVKLGVQPNAIQCLPQDQVEPFLRFVKDLLSRPKQRLIPQLEQWHPGIGITLMHFGYGMMHVNQELKLQHYIQVFQILYNSPDYRKMLLDRGKFGHAISSLVQKQFEESAEESEDHAVVDFPDKQNSDNSLHDTVILKEGLDR